MEKEYLTQNEAGQLLSPGCKEVCEKPLVHGHVRNGNIHKVFPELAIIDSQGNIIQRIGTPLTFYRRSEIEHYLKHEKPVNLRKGRFGKPIVAYSPDHTKEFSNVRLAAEQLGIGYWSLLKAIDTGTEIKGYKFKSKK
jgi:hypothetical protein